MLFRLTKLTLGCALLMVLWAMCEVREPGRPVWVRSEGPPGPVKITEFYASAGALKLGEKAQLCYGVENAKSVHIAPPLDGVYPASNRCIEIVPQRTTHYTMLAEGFDGRVATRSFTILVEGETPKPERRFINFAEILLAQ